MILHKDAHEAIREGNARGNGFAVAYRRPHGWLVYDVRHGPPTDADEPEILCLGLGRFPLALSESGAMILANLAVRRKARA